MVQTLRNCLPFRVKKTLIYPNIGKAVLLPVACRVYLPLHYSIPTMEDLGFESAALYTNVWVGGETEALRRIPQYCQLRCQNTENNVR